MCSKVALLSQLVGRLVGFFQARDPTTIFVVDSRGNREGVEEEVEIETCLLFQYRATGGSLQLCCADRGERERAREPSWLRKNEGWPKEYVYGKRGYWKRERARQE